MEITSEVTALAVEKESLVQDAIRKAKKTTKKERVGSADPSLFSHATARNFIPTGIITPVQFVKRMGKKIIDEGKAWIPFVPHYEAQGGKPHPSMLQRLSVHEVIQTPTPHVDVLLDRGMVEQGVVSMQQLEIVAQSLSRHAEYVLNSKGDPIRKGYAVPFGAGSGKTTISWVIALAHGYAKKEKQTTIILTRNQLIFDVFEAQAQELGISLDDIHCLKHASLDSFMAMDMKKHPYLIATYALLRGKFTGITQPKARMLLIKHACSPLAPLVTSALEKAVHDKKEFLTLHIAEAIAVLLGKDGLYLLDECDALRNTNSDQGAAYQYLDANLPNGKFVFLSASISPDMNSLKYIAERLGTVGKGCIIQSPEKLKKLAQDDISYAESMVAESVASGSMTIASLSYEGIEYKTVITQTNETQRLHVDHIMVTLSSMVRTASHNLKRIQAVLSQNTGVFTPIFTLPSKSDITMGIVRFCRRFALDLCKESLFAEIDAAIARGEQVVVQVAETGASDANYAEKSEEKNVSGHYLRMQDFIKALAIPFRTKIVKKHDGTQILVDRNPEATAAIRSMFEKTLNAISDNNHILTELEERYGNMFGEITGRSKIVYKKNGALITKKRNAIKENRKAIHDFNEGNIRVLAVSEAGSRGIELHASINFGCKAQRHLMIYDAFPSPAEFSQAMGRLSRTGQVSWPKVTFFRVDIPAFGLNVANTVDKMRIAGACSYGDRRSLSIASDDDVNIFDERGTCALKTMIMDSWENNYPLNQKMILQFYGIKNTEYQDLTPVKREKIKDTILKNAHKLARRMVHLPVEIQVNVWDTIARNWAKGEYPESANGIPRRHAKKITFKDAWKIGHGRIAQATLEESPFHNNFDMELAKNKDMSIVSFGKDLSGTPFIFVKLPDWKQYSGAIITEYKSISPESKMIIPKYVFDNHIEISKDECRSLFDAHISAMSTTISNYYIGYGSLNDITRHYHSLIEKDEVGNFPYDIAKSAFFESEVKTHIDIKNIAMFRVENIGDVVGIILKPKITEEILGLTPISIT